MEQYKGDQGAAPGAGDREKGSPMNPPVADLHKVAASTECTGLIPSAVESEDEVENYQRLYGIHRQRPMEIQDVE